MYLTCRKKESADSENRDARTVFVMQLSQRVRERDLKEFFVSIGKVRLNIDSLRCKIHNL